MNCNKSGDKMGQNTGAGSASPVAYIKAARTCVERGFDTAAADSWLAVLRRPTTGAVYNTLHIPADIPVRYHARMQALWRVIIARIIFSRAGAKVGYAERTRLLGKVK